MYTLLPSVTELYPKMTKWCYVNRDSLHFSAFKAYCLQRRSVGGYEKSRFVGDEM